MFKNKLDDYFKRLVKGVGHLGHDEAMKAGGREFCLHGRVVKGVGHRRHGEAMEAAGREFSLHGRVVKGVGHLGHVEAMECGRSWVRSPTGALYIVGWVFSPTRQLVRFSHLNVPFFPSSEFIWNILITGHLRLSSMKPATLKTDISAMTIIIISSGFQRDWDGVTGVCRTGLAGIADHFGVSVVARGARFASPADVLRRTVATRHLVVDFQVTFAAEPATTDDGRHKRVKHGSILFSICNWLRHFSGATWWSI